MKSNYEIYRNKVLGYINDKDTSPLVFVRGEIVSFFTYRELSTNLNLETRIEFLRSIENLDNLVIEIIRTSENYFSKNTITGVIETMNNRRRSVLDIWRHVKYFKSEVTIFQVMEILFRLRDNFRYMFCRNVQRRVFTLGTNVIIWGFGNRRGHHNEYTKDEFGLLFKQWKNISVV